MRTAIRPTEVLSIDDNPADQGLMKLFFSSVYPPVKLTFVEDGKQALDYLKAKEKTIEETESGPHYFGP